MILYMYCFLEDDDSGDTPAVEKLTDTSGVDKLSEG